MLIKLPGDLSISRIALGCMRLHEWKLDQRELIALIEWCLDNGINTFDHADIYGGSHRNEQLFGAALNHAPSLKTKINIVTKCSIVIEDNTPNPSYRHYNTDADYIVKQVDGSLAALGVEQIDVLLVHMFDLLVRPDKLAETLGKLIRQGKVNQIGLSNHAPHELDLMQSNSIQKFVVHQFKLNPLDVTNLVNGVMTQCLAKDIHPMVWSPVAGGELFSFRSEKSKKMGAVLESIASEQGHSNLDQIVYQWLLMHPAKPTVVLGTGDYSRIRNALYAEHANVMSRSQWYRITEAAGYPLW